MLHRVLAGAVFVLTLAALVGQVAAQPVPPPSEIPLFTPPKEPPTPSGR